MLEYVRQNPFRVVDWRWRRVPGVLDGTMPTSPRRDGPTGRNWIRRGARFLTAYNRCATPEDYYQLSMSYPGIFWAYYIWRQEEHPARWAIEARLLARENDCDIGFRCGVPEPVVAAYESLFFNVREKLPYVDYIVNCVMGPAVHKGLQERDHDVLWKLFGFMGGPFVLDSLITKFSSPLWVMEPDSVSAFMQDTAINTMKMKAALAAVTVPVNRRTQLALLDIFNKYVEVERMTESAGKTQDQILGHIDAMLTNLPFTVGNEGAVDANRMQRYDKAGVELRYEEMMIVAAGFRLPAESRLLEMAFPDRPAIAAQPAAATGS